MSDKVVIPIVLDTAKFQKDLKAVGNELNKIEQEQATKKRLQIRIDIAKMQSDLAKARAEVVKFQKYGNEKAKVKAELNVANFKSSITKAEAELNKFKSNSKTKAKVDAELRLDKLKAGLLKAESELKRYKSKNSKIAEIDARLKVDQLQTNIKKAKTSLRSLDDSAKKTKTSFLKLNGVAKGFLQAAGVVGAIGAVTVAVRKLGRAMVDTVRASLDFEKSFVGIRKTTNATEAEFKALENEFRNLAKEIPLSVNELNRIGELGGQLGVAKGELVDFTKTIAAIGVSTNLSTEEAATALARIGNIYQKGASDVDNYGASIVDLGNNFATTEKEITTFSTRIAGAGKVVGLSEADLFGIGTAFTSVGVQAESGGTAVQKVLFGISNAANAGGESLDKFARVSGMSSSEFSKLWKDDAAGAFTEFVEGLGKSGKYGQQVLGELGLEDQRLVRGFLAVAAAGGLMGNAIDTSNKAFEKNAALMAEAEKFYTTGAGKIQIMKNEFYDLAITIGDGIVNAIAPFVTALGDMANGINKFLRNTNALKGLLVALMVALVPLGVAFGAAVAPVLAWGAGIYAAWKILGPVVMLVGDLLVAIGVLGTNLSSSKESTDQATNSLQKYMGVVGALRLVLDGLVYGVKLFGETLNQMGEDLQRLAETDEQTTARLLKDSKLRIAASVKEAYANGETTKSMLKDVVREKAALIEMQKARETATGKAKKELDKRIEHQKVWIEIVEDELIKAAVKAGDLGEAFSTAFAESSTSSEMLRKLKKAGVDISRESVAGILNESVKFGDAGKTQALLFAYGIEDTIPDAVETADDLKSWTIDALTAKKAEQQSIYNNTKGLGQGYVSGILNGIKSKVPALTKTINSILKVINSSVNAMKKFNLSLPKTGAFGFIGIAAANAGLDFKSMNREIADTTAALNELKKVDDGYTPTGGGGGGGGKSKADEEAKQAAKALDDQQKEFNKTLEESQKIAEEASKSLESMYDEALDSIESALIKQDELTQSLADYKQEADKKLTATAATTELDDKEEIAKIEEKIAKLKSDLNDEDADSQSINEDIKELQDEKKKIEADLVSIQEYKNGLTEDELATIKRIQELEDRRRSASGNFELAQINTEEAKRAKDAEIQLEIEKQNKIIDIQNKFLELSASTDEEVMAKKAELTEVLTATTKEEMEKRAKLLEELGFEELTAAEELALTKQIARQTELQTILDEQIGLQKILLDTKVEFLKKFEGKNKESLDVLKAQTDELIQKYKDATSALQSLISVQAAASKDGYGLGGFTGAANKPDAVEGSVTNNYYIQTETVDQGFLDNVSSQGN